MENDPDIGKRREGYRLSQMLQGLKDKLNNFKCLMSKSEVADTDSWYSNLDIMELFRKWHDIHFQFEEHWKFAGVTTEEELNPIMYRKL